MKNKKSIFLLIVLLFFVSCNKSNENNYDCDLAHHNTEEAILYRELDDGSLIFLTGYIKIDTKGKIIFHDIKNKDETVAPIDRPELIPFTKDLRKSIYGMYDVCVYTNNYYQDKFWITVEGKYLPRKDLEERPLFLVTWVGFISEEEVLENKYEYYK